MLRSDLGDYSHTYTVMKAAITVAGNNANNWANKELAFKNDTPCDSCISKIMPSIIHSCIHK